MERRRAHEMRRVVANGVADAFGDFLLSRHRDPFGAVLLVLARLPP